MVNTRLLFHVQRRINININININERTNLKSNHTVIQCWWVHVPIASAHVSVDPQEKDHGVHEREEGVDRGLDALADRQVVWTRVVHQQIQLHYRSHTNERVPSTTPVVGIARYLEVNGAHTRTSKEILVPRGKQEMKYTL